MNKEIPILFSTPMVQAILAGNKTMTRRIIKKDLLIQKDKYRVGDLLWVKETFCIDEDASPLNTYPYFFKASISYPEEYKWKPSIFMPKDAARIWLEVIGVRVEELHKISEKDAIAEGVSSIYQPSNFGGSGFYRPDRALEQTAKSCFEHLWNSINGNWDKNPFVWVIEFKTISR